MISSPPNTSPTKKPKDKWAKLYNSPNNWVPFSKLNPEQQVSARRLVEKSRRLDIKAFGKSVDNTPVEKCTFDIWPNGKVSHTHYLTK